MKRNLTILLSAMLAVLLWQGSPSAGYGPEPVGYVQVSEGDVAAINSDVMVVRANNQEECRTLGRGAGVYSNDIIITGAGSKLQVMFLDGSMLVVGDETQIKVGAFQYNYEDPQQNQQEVTLVSGQCRFASGRVVETRPEGLVLGTPEMEVDLRGTEVGLSVTITDSNLAELAAQLSAMFSNVANMTPEERAQAEAFLSQVLGGLLASMDQRDVLEISVSYFSSSGTGHTIDITLYDSQGNVIGTFMLTEDQVLVVGPNGETTVVPLTIEMLNQFINTMFNNFANVPTQLQGQFGTGGDNSIGGGNSGGDGDDGGNGGDDSGGDDGGSSGSSGSSGSGGSDINYPDPMSSGD